MPNEQFEKQYEEFGQEILKEGQEAYLAKRIEDATAKMDQILAGKRKKVAKSGGDPNEVTEETILEDVRTRAINEVPNIVHVQVPTQEPFDVGKNAYLLKYVKYQFIPKFPFSKQILRKSKRCRT